MTDPWLYHRQLAYPHAHDMVMPMASPRRSRGWAYGGMGWMLYRRYRLTFFGRNFLGRGQNCPLTMATFHGYVMATFSGKCLIQTPSVYTMLE